MLGQMPLATENSSDNAASNSTRCSLPAVTKDQSGDRASVRIESIHDNRKTRVGELARMLGDRSAKSAQAHAEELLKLRG